MYQYLYQNPELSPEERVKDLLGRMSLDEKVRQICGEIVMNEIPEEQLKDGIGELVVYSPKQSLRDMAEFTNKVQETVVQNSRWGIPVIIHAEALCGGAVPGMTPYPSPIGLGASFMPELVEEMAGNIREELKNVGIRQALSPVLDLARDFRWGRTNETYGSDPTLVSEFGCAYVKGLQTDHIENGVAATCKHFLGYSVSEGGLNTARTVTDNKDLRENFAKPFEAVIRKAGVKSIMNSYSEYDGESISASKKILTDLLRKDLGFNGTVVSDYSSLIRLTDNVQMAEDYQKAGIMAIQAGMDVELPNPVCFGKATADSVRSGMLDEKYLDQAAGRILKLKFELGLFENPYCEYQESDSHAAYELSRTMTQKTLTLTQNNGILPIKNTETKIVVIGPTGNNLRMMSGCYSVAGSIDMIFAGMSQEGVDNESAVGVPEEYQRMDTAVTQQIDGIIRQMYPMSKTIYESVKAIYPNTEYEEGCDIGDCKYYEKDKVIKAAEKADVVILTLGGKNGWGSNCTDGEGLDNTSIGLPGSQETLMKDVYEVNPNIIIIHTDNKPLVSTFAYEHIPAIIEGWLPGIYGGEVLAECIKGSFCPGGKLPVDIPRSTGQTPVYYYQQKGSRTDGVMYGINKHGYRNEPCRSARPFGYGMSYTSFQYECQNMCVSEDGETPVISFTVCVKNTGNMEGDEIVQLYGIDEFASVIRPQKLLLGFKRLNLKPGETKRVCFTINLNQMAFPNKEGKWVLEEGNYIFEIGRDSQNIEKTYPYKLSETISVDHTKREFYAQAREEK